MKVYEKGDVVGMPPGYAGVIVEIWSSTSHEEYAHVIPLSVMLATPARSDHKRAHHSYSRELPLSLLTPIPPSDEFS